MHAAGCQVVQEEERRRALHRNVVDAVVYQVRADGVVNAQFERDLQLGSHAVGAGDQHWLRKFLQIQGKQPAEAANLREHMLVEGLARQHLDALLGAVARGDVHPSIVVGCVALDFGRDTNRFSMWLVCGVRQGCMGRAGKGCSAECVTGGLEGSSGTRILFNALHETNSTAA